MSDDMGKNVGKHLADVDGPGPIYSMPQTGGQAIACLNVRDYFAAQAMAGMMARDDYDEGQATPEQRANLAYIEADAMLKARAR